MRRELSQAGNFGVTFQRGNRKVLSSFRVCDKMSGTVFDSFLLYMEADMKYKCLIFDLDGTLTESGEGITKCVQYALEKLGRPESDLEKLKVFIGPPLMEQFMKYADLDEATARKAVEYYRERYSTTGIFENCPYPGVEKLLQ